MQLCSVQWGLGSDSDSATGSASCGNMDQQKLAHIDGLHGMVQKQPVHLGHETCGSHKRAVSLQVNQCRTEAEMESRQLAHFQLRSMHTCSGDLL